MRLLRISENRMLRKGVAVACGMVGGVSLPAQAGPMDFALERLVEDESCRTLAGEMTDQVCRGDQAAFTRLVNQYALALAPSAMLPAQTTGYGGIEISLEAVWTQVHSQSEALRKGTRGQSGGIAGENESPDSLLQLYSVRVRKGFGLGVELLTQFGGLAQTGMLTGGLDLRWAIWEGMRVGWSEYLPDLAWAASLRTMTGSTQMQMTVASTQLVASRPFSVARTGELTPWLGYQFLWMFGQSSSIDWTPGTDAHQSCVQGVGAEGCTPQVSADLHNYQSFDLVTLQRQRLFAGVQYQYEFVIVGAQLAVDTLSPEQAQTDERNRAALQGEPRQAAFSLQVGTRF